MKYDVDIRKKPVVSPVDAICYFRTLLFPYTKSMTTSKTSLILLFIFGLFLWIPIGRTQSSAEFKKEQEVVRVQMVQLSRELGVTCTECHSQKNWKDGSKPSFKVGLKHMKIVDVLRQNGMDGRNGPEASCFMCHQGKLKFAHKMAHPEPALKAEKTGD